MLTVCVASRHCCVKRGAAWSRVDFGWTVSKRTALLRFRVWNRWGWLWLVCGCLFGDVPWVQRPTQVARSICDVASRDAPRPSKPRMPSTDACGQPCPRRFCPCLFLLTPLKRYVHHQHSHLLHLGVLACCSVTCRLVCRSRTRAAVCVVCVVWCVSRHTDPRAEKGEGGRP